MKMPGIRLQGKSSKDLKEAFIELRASFHYVSKQLEDCRVRRRELSQENSKLLKQIKKLENLISKNTADSDYRLKLVKDNFSSEKSQLNSLITKLSKKTTSLEAALEKSRSRSNYHQKVKYSKGVIIKNLRITIKDLNKEIKNLNNSLERLKSKQVPKPKIVSKVDKVYVTKVEREPLPDKIRQLMSEGVVTKTRLDFVSIATVLLNFSDKTKLTLRQCVMLLELSNLNYFKHEQLNTQSNFTLVELEDKGLIKGDRTFTKKAVGWYITEKGKRVVELLYKRLYDYQKINKQIVKNED